MDRSSKGGRARTRRFEALLVLAGSLAVAPLVACASRGQLSEEDEAIAAALESDSVYVTVKNQYRLDVNVYALYGGGARQFLGIVTSWNSRDFGMPGALAVSTRFRIAADPIGSNQNYVTEEILVRMGDVVTVTVLDPLAQSYYTVY
jgi:hypothetical protein